jgi:dihydrofolate reductase
MGLKLGGGKISSFGMKCCVFRGRWAAGAEDFTIVKDPPKPFIEALRKKGQGHLVDGRRRVDAQFLREDLVDELYLGVVPVLIGEGIPAFPSGFPQREYKLTENKTFSQGLIALKYERVRTKKKAQE